MTAPAIKWKLVLASSSPRRRALLEAAGVQFEVVDPPLDEPAQQNAALSPAQHAEALAYFKARAVAEARRDAVILAGDTIVCLGGEILGKAADADDARRMLSKLSGTRHAVITGVAILTPDGRRLIDSAVTYVTMRQMSEAEIDAYVASGEWIDKAGAYAIQETADRYVQSVEGSFDNVVGLPTELVLRMLRRLREFGDEQ